MTLGNADIAEIMAKAGFDWLVVDLEHSVIDLDMAGHMIRVIDLCGVPPLVRLTSNDPNQIKRVMDAGAHGIIVPMVNSAREAERAVAAVHYPPNGSRGVGLGRAQGYGAGFREYMAWQEDGPIVLVQIEHRTAVENLESIFAVPGVDGFIIGPYDLSCSMGIPGQFETQQFAEVLAHVSRTAQRLNMPAGLHVVEPDEAQLARALNDGYRIIAYGVDIRILDVGAREGLRHFKKMIAR